MSALPARAAPPPRRPSPLGPSPLGPSPLGPSPLGPSLLGLSLFCLICAGGCTTPRHEAARGSDGGVPSVSSLQRAASVAANGGNVNVQLVDGVAYVTGRVDSALEESAIERALRRIDGVERVETALQRNM